MTGFPWYDSPWLATYARAKAWIARTHPARLAEFEARLAPLRTDPGFEVKQIAQVFDEATLQRIRETIRALTPAKLRMHEIRDFGRFVVHNLPYFTELQQDLVDAVSEAAREQVEPCYNVLALYTKLGECEIHMDAPEAKWTLDLCVEQSTVWPIHFSPILPWPEEPGLDAQGWQEAIKRDARNRFTSYAPQPGEALLFSGSSQWHYRDPLPRAGGSGHFCNLLFFHFIPRGTAELAKPRSWPSLFGLPALAEITDRYVPGPY